MTATDPAYSHLILLCIAGVIAIGVIAAATAFIVVGRAAFGATSATATATFGLLFQALPSVLTITLIILATAVLTSYHYIESSGCIAVFSSVASFVLGAESQRKPAALSQMRAAASADHETPPSRDQS